MSLRSILPIPLIVALAGFVATLAAGGIDSSAESSTQESRMSATEAISTARAMSGVGRSGSGTDSASRSTEQANASLALVQTVKDANHPVWEVVLDPVSLEFNQWEPDANGEKQFRIRIDDSTGLPVDVWGVSIPWSDSVGCGAELDALEGEFPAAVELMSDYDSSRTQLPTEKPVITFRQALERHRFGSPISAKFIWAKYAIVSCGSAGQRPAWVIGFFGLPPMFERNETAITEWLTVVDALTGDLIWTSNAPCSVVKEE